MPDRSPLMSAANTGTPARANPSAITCNETVFPVPVAPVTSPCRLASPSVSHASCSPLPIKIFSSVSAFWISVIAITSPSLCTPHSPSVPFIRHVASRLKPSTNEYVRETRYDERAFNRFCRRASSIFERNSSVKVRNRRLLLHCCNTRDAIHINDGGDRL